MSNKPQKGESKEMEEGREARRQKLPLTANPYNKLGDRFQAAKHIEWEGGWDFEDFERLGMDEGVPNHG